jgi:hypothetical protein
MNDNWESEISALLTELSGVQSELLSLLSEKRTSLVNGDSQALAALQAREAVLAERLQSCHEQRQKLLERAAAAGRPADSIRALTDSLLPEHRGQLQPAVESARGQARLLQHESLANWVLIQRSLLHLSQMIEIIATGGQRQPTYGVGASNTGALVDRAV